ncbi:MAG: methionyl-tRNA formyltransferase, partial [Prevotella sp.]|nr:methionyl-tRNA formyltransferase [Prevotella sp.]
FMGTPEFAVGTLRRLVESDYNVVAVVTQPDKPAGRHAVLTPPAVKTYALGRGIPVLQPVKMKDEEFLSRLASYRADVQVVVAFRMLPEAVWSMPKYGTFNVHASLLPMYRGAAPINRALINGEKESGITTFMLDKEIDTGRIILQKRVSIPDEADFAWLYTRLMTLGADAAEETLERIIAGNGSVETVPQDNSLAVCPAPKIFKETCEIDWGLTSKRVYDFVRGLSPVPGAWSRLAFDNIETHRQTVKIYRTMKTNTPSAEAPGTVIIEKKHMFVAASDYWVELLELQIAGKRRMSAEDVINGLHL